MDVRPIRFGFATQALQRASASVQHRFHHSVRQRCRQRPGKLGSRRALDGERHRAARDANRSGNRSLGRATLILEAQDLSYTSHRHSLGWHRLPRSSFPTTSKRPLLRPAVERRPHPSRVADFKSEWPRSNRNRWPTSFRNQWPTCSGISNLTRPPWLTRRNCVKDADEFGARVFPPSAAAGLRYPESHLARLGI